MKETNLPKILLSAVGNTDPISNFYDGALLHLARYLRPEKIVLIFSKDMLERKEEIYTAIASIPDYRPEIFVHEDLINDNDVYKFDLIFDFMSQVIDDYQSDDIELVLNLSSGTPQIKSALFTLNRIKEYNVSAYQVATPLKAPLDKRRQGEDPKLPIDEAIATNKDNFTINFERITKDEGEKFSRSLIIRNLKTLVKNYDYQAFHTLLSSLNLSSIEAEQYEQLTEYAESLLNVFRYHKSLNVDLLEKVGEDWSALSSEQVNSLRYLLMIDVLRRRGMLADVLIKMKSLAEFMIEHYLEKTYPDLIEFREQKPYLNKNHQLADDIFDQLENDFKKRPNYDPSHPFDKDRFLSFPTYKIILDYLEAENEELINAVQVIKTYNRPRNTVAHGLAELSRKKLEDEKLEKIITSLSTIYKFVYDTDYLPLDLYDRINAKLIEELN